MLAGSARRRHSHFVTIDFTDIFTIIQDEIPYSCEVVIDSFRDKTPQLSVIEACIVVSNIFSLVMIFYSYFVFYHVFFISLANLIFNNEHFSSLMFLTF
jgi:hypothetical protein